jgi:hypothetical protein
MEIHAAAFSVISTPSVLSALGVLGVPDVLGVLEKF